MNRQALFSILLLVYYCSYGMDDDGFESCISYAADNKGSIKNWEQLSFTTDPLTNAAVGQKSVLPQTEQKKDVPEKSTAYDISLSSMAQILNDFFDRYSSPMNPLFTSSITDIPFIGSFYQAHKGYVKLGTFCGLCYFISRKDCVKKLVKKLKIRCPSN